MASKLDTEANNNILATNNLMSVKEALDAGLNENASSSYTEPLYICAKSSIPHTSAKAPP